MGSLALVGEQIKDGQRLIEELKGDGFPVSAGAWVEESDSDRWYLYLVTPLVGAEGGTRKAYDRLGPVMRRLQSAAFWIGPFDVKVIGPTNPVGEAIVAIQRRHQNKPLIRYEGASLGNMSVETAYVYPPLPDAAA